MVDLTSTWHHQHRRRRKKNKLQTPSPALLASLAAFITPAVLARPILLPFLYPSIPSTSSQPSTSRPKYNKRSPTADNTASTSRQPSTSPTPPDSEPRRADRIAYNYQPDDDGHFQPECWRLHGQSNCPRDDSSYPTSPDDTAINDPDVHEVVPGAQPDFTSTPSSSSTSSTITTPTPTPTTTSAPSSTTTQSSPTVEPYTMTFDVTNIPPGWQKSGRTSFYSKRMIIGFSVTLAALICLTIVLCVIWRIRVARERRESEKALKEKKRELGIASRSSISSETLWDAANDQDRDESTRQRGLRRRRANVRAGSDDDEDDNNDDAMSEKNGMTPRKSRKAVPFMRSFSGKMLVSPGKWKKKGRGRKQQEAEQEQEDEGEGGETQQPAPTEQQQNLQRRASPLPPLETQNSFSPLLVTSLSTEVPPPPPPPPPPAPVRAEEDDQANENELHPPAYRRRNFGVRSAPLAAPTTTAMSARAREKQREASGEGGEVQAVPEEYMYVAGMMPPSSGRIISTPAAVEREGPVVVVEQDREEEEDEEGEESQDGPPTTTTTTAHLATDDKAVLAQLHQVPSAPPLPTSNEPPLEALVPQEEDVYPLEDESAGQTSGSGSSSSTLTFLPAPPTITSAHLFAVEEEEEGLPRYVAGPSAPLGTMGGEKAPSAPPVEEELVAIVPSAPPVDEDALVVGGPSAPPLEYEEEEIMGRPSAPPA